jgi:hypothetical protein
MAALFFDSLVPTRDESPARKTPEENPVKEWL